VKRLVSCPKCWGRLPETRWCHVCCGAGLVPSGDAIEYRLLSDKQQKKEV